VTRTFGFVKNARMSPVPCAPQPMTPSVVLFDGAVSLRSTLAGTKYGAMPVASTVWRKERRWVMVGSETEDDSEPCKPLDKERKLAP